MQSWGRLVVMSPCRDLWDYGESFCFIPEEPEVHGDVGGICCYRLFFEPWQESCSDPWMKPEGLDCPPPPL